MKDIIRNPFFYYILVPVIVALWPLLAWAVWLPGAQRSCEQENTEYKKSQEIMIEILTIDPDRLAFADSNAVPVDFSYANAVDRVATLCRIPAANYKLSSGIIITSDKQKSQGAKVVLKDVDVTTFAKFLSTIQLRWSKLQCTQVKLTKKKPLPDKWDVDMDFKYYY
jgi:hypothetical protein